MRQVGSEGGREGVQRQSSRALGGEAASGGGGTRWACLRSFVLPSYSRCSWPGAGHGEIRAREVSSSLVFGQTLDPEACCLSTVDVASARLLASQAIV